MDKVLQAAVVVACFVGIVVGILYITDKVRCFDVWPLTPSKVCAIK